MQIRRDLVRFAQERTVKFVFSGVAISESVSLTADAVHFAERRADLLSELCGTNTFVSMDRLLHAEAFALTKKCNTRINMLDPDGNWFPEISNLEPTESPLKMFQQRAENDVKEIGLNREQRRAAEKKIKRKGRNKKSGLMTYLDSLNASSLADELSKQYPIKPEFMKVGVNYILGRAGEDEFTNALIVSLRDPRWMMRWFTYEHASSSSIAEIVRKPGREISKHLREKIQFTKNWAKFQQEHDLNKDPTSKKGDLMKRWMESQDDLLVDIIRRSITDQKLNVDTISASDIDIYCPGVSSMIRSLFSSAWDNIGGSRTELPSDSQPVDALHALYAPYVDVFRADRYMSPHIQKQVKKHGTEVVSKLTDLVGTLKRRV